MRKTAKVETPVTEAEYNSALATFSDSSAKLRVINAELEEAINKLREAKATEIATLTAVQSESFETVQKYCVDNSEILFAKKKSIETVFGTVGLRTGNPTLKTLAKGITWAMVLENIKNAKLKGYIRTSEEVDKEKLLADRTDPKVFKKFQTLGIKVVQSEAFYIELKAEEAAEV